MSFTAKVLKNDEKAIYNLRSLYKEYGYSLYKVGKFEEYDLYASNRSFLVSGNILSFTDTDGKLLALKPDVTLSIVKNISDGDMRTHKFCYNENVYRTSANSNGFKEIMQTGLECIGDIDLYSECEVITLAIKSLNEISEDSLLDISHMGFIDGLLTEARIDESKRSELLSAIESKNTHALEALCDGIDDDMKQRLSKLASIYMPINEALSTLETMVIGEKMRAAYENLCGIGKMLKASGLDSKIFVDFSVVNDVSYYDGVCFKGFVNGLPDSVLSGGRYDGLLARLGKKQGAIGFAVYLDCLERLDSGEDKYDVDTLIVYGKDVDVAEIAKARAEFSKNGESVLVCSAPDKELRYKRLVKITDGGIETIETND